MTTKTEPYLKKLGIKQTTRKELICLILFSQIQIN